MSAFWIYENWVHDRVRIHRASCVWCNNGDGFHDTTSTANGQWLPFDTYREAAGAASVTGRADVADCPTCHPADSN